MKVLFFILIIIFFAQVTNAQKSKSELKDYTYQASDKYNPKTAKLLAIIPGVGHFYSGNYLRGFVFPVGMAASLYLFSAGSLSAWASGWDSNPHIEGGASVLIGAIGFVGFYTFNFIDAGRMAKLKNIQFRNAASIHIKPSIQCYSASQFPQYASGVSICITF